MILRCKYEGWFSNSIYNNYIVNKNARPKRAGSNRNVQIEKLNVEIHFNANIFAADRSEAFISDIIFIEIE